jgi:hypothetical protein
MKSVWNRLLKPKPDIQEAKKEPELIVGEPVISFVALVNNNPRRFKKRLKYYVNGKDFQVRYYITDLLTKEVFWFSEEVERTWRNYDSKVFEYKYSGKPDFITQDEWKYIVSNIDKELNQKVEDRYRSIKSAKDARLKQEDRQRLIDVYCK